MDYHREIHRQGCGSAMPQNIFILILFLILFLILASSPLKPLLKNGVIRALNSDGNLFYSVRKTMKEKDFQE
jgi:hypothetical protein